MSRIARLSWSLKRHVHWRETIRWWPHPTSMPRRQTRANSCRAGAYGHKEGGDRSGFRLRPDPRSTTLEPSRYRAALDIAQLYPSISSRAQHRDARHFTFHKRCVRILPSARLPLLRFATTQLNGSVARGHFLPANKLKTAKSTTNRSKRAKGIDKNADTEYLCEISHEL